MSNDLLEKGAILQRDKETYAIAPHIPGGITTPAMLRKLADVAEKYNAAAIKITSAQRIAVVGLPEDKLDEIWAGLGEKPGAAIGLCVRSVKMCPGTTFCKKGQQDSVTVGLELDKRYHGFELPWKFKMGVSGCMNDCAETCIKDIGLVGKPKGWTLKVGGNGGGIARLSMPLVEGIATNEEALGIIDKIVNWFKEQGKVGRLGKIIEDTGGMDNFKEAILK